MQPFVKILWLLVLCYPTFVLPKLSERLDNWFVQVTLEKVCQVIYSAVVTNKQLKIILKVSINDDDNCGCVDFSVCNIVGIMKCRWFSLLRRCANSGPTAWRQLICWETWITLLVFWLLGLKAWLRLDSLTLLRLAVTGVDYTSYLSWHVFVIAHH